MVGSIIWQWLTTGKDSCPSQMTDCPREVRPWPTQRQSYLLTRWSPNSRERYFFFFLWFFFFLLLLFVVCLLSTTLYNVYMHHFFTRHLTPFSRVEWHTTITSKRRFPWVFGLVDRWMTSTNTRVITKTFGFMGGSPPILTRLWDSGKLHPATSSDLVAHSSRT